MMWLFSDLIGTSRRIGAGSLKLIRYLGSHRTLSSYGDYFDVRGWEYGNVPPAGRRKLACFFMGGARSTWFQAVLVQAAWFSRLINLEALL
jgi:hypothetical protein